MRLVHDTLRALRAGVLAAVTLSVSAIAAAATISAGTPVTSVPSYLSDGSYLFGITVPPLGADDFLLPVEIDDASKLQQWSLDLAFDNTVVQHVDPGDGSAGLYGARFDPADADSLSFILSGFPDNAAGLVGTLAGEYPSLLQGPSGDGVLAWVLFRFLPGQADEDPGFDVRNAVVYPAPLPGTLALACAAGLALATRRRPRERASDDPSATRVA